MSERAPEPEADSLEDSPAEQGLGDSLSKQELHSATFRGLRWTMIARPASEVAVAASMLVLTRLVAPAEFGRYAVSAVALALGIIPAGAINAAFVQGRAMDRTHVQAAFALSLLTSVVMTALMLLAAATVVAPVFDSQTATLVVLSAPNCLVMTACTVPLSLIQRRLEFKRLAIINIMTSAVTAIAAIALAIAGMEAKALVLGALAATIVIGILQVAWGRPPAPKLTRGAMRDLLTYAGAFSLASLSWVGFTNCDYAIIAARVSPLAAGFYFRAYSTGVQYQNKIGQVMTSVAFPVLSRAQTADDMDQFRGRMSQALALVLFPLLALLAITAPVVVPWLYGRAWAPAVVPTQFLVIGGAATLLINAVGVVFQAAGRKRALIGYGWGHFLCYATAVFVTAPHGIVAVAVAAAVVHSAFLVVAYVLLFPARPVHALSKIAEDTLPTLSCTAALAAVAIPLSHLLHETLPAVPYLAAVCAAGGGTYLLVLRLLFPASWSRVSVLATRLLPRRRLRPSRFAPEVPTAA